jgi:hypothetical protein
MKKSEEYLESKAFDNWLQPNLTVRCVSFEHAMTALKIQELSNKIISWEKLQSQFYNSSRQVKINACESEIETLMKS